ncbi:MAG: hypothetical protein ACFE9R_16120, partial [Candidatus Hermodarchaeota archaeon]
MVNKVNASRVFKFIICVLILNYLVSSMLYSNLLDIYQNYSTSIYVKPKSNDAPSIVIDFPLNYSLYG